MFDRECGILNMLTYRFHIFGILLFLLRFVHPFVLLTANVEDVKKLAGKFVSDSLAETIAEFIAKATEYMVTNVSKEQDVDDTVSAENVQYNIARKQKIVDDGHQLRNDLSLSSPEILESQEEHRKNIVNDDTNTPETTTSKFINIKERDKNKDVSNNYLKPKKRLKKSKHLNKNIQPLVNIKNQSLKQYSYALDVKDGVKEKSKYLYSKEKLKTSTDPALSTIGYEETIGSEERAYKKLKLKKSRGLSHRIKNIEDVEANNTNSNEVNVPRAITELTTEKARTAFDQYDNLNYPKPDFVATSGPVLLPKIPAHKKWFNDVKANDDGRKKYWF